MTDRLTIANASKVSGAEFYTAVTGRQLRTKQQREAEWLADCERYADMIERGGGWAVPPPCREAARRIVAERFHESCKLITDRMMKRRAA